MPLPDFLLSFVARHLVLFSKILDFVEVKPETNNLIHAPSPSLELSHQLRREIFTTWFENGTFIFRLPAVLRCFLGTDQETSEPSSKAKLTDLYGYNIYVLFFYGH